MKLRSLSLVCMFAVLFAANADAGITMSPSNIYAVVYNAATFTSGSQSFPGSTIPTHTTVNAVTDGSHSYNSVNWDVFGGQTILSLGMDHKRVGTLDSYAQTSNFPLNFTANSNEPYEVTGYYDVTDVGAASTASMYVQLRDRSLGDLYYDEQISTSTTNEHFTVGGAGGDNYNYSYGSPTGYLIAGHNYQFIAYGYTKANPADSGATALGNFTLRIGTATAVPEPLSFIVWGGVIIGAVTVVRRVKFLHG